MGRCTHAKKKNPHKSDITDMVLWGGEVCMVSVRSKQLSKCPNLFQAVMVEPDRAHTHTQKHNSQLQPRDLPKIIPLLFTMRGFTRLGPKISEPLLTTSGLPAGPWTPVWRLKCLILVNWMAFWAQSPDNISNEMSREDNGKAANLVFMRSLFVSGEHL